MNRLVFLTILLVSHHLISLGQTHINNTFPNGTPMSDWLLDGEKVDTATLGRRFVITDYGAVRDSSISQTYEIQHTINEAANAGGGVVVIPHGVFVTGALHFKPNTHLYISEFGVLRGSERIRDYPVTQSRIDGACQNYNAALINVHNLNGFTITGKGIIDGNGTRFWRAFWRRHSEKGFCTNAEVPRPRLIFVQNSQNIHLQDVKLWNAGYTTTHFYQCKNIKLIDLQISTPRDPIPAANTDAFNLDVCQNVLIKNCFVSVNNVGIALKGGKGPWAATNTQNGENKNILIEDCEFGYCTSALSLGSESVHNHNVVMRHCHVVQAKSVLQFKMRPDTPQLYEHIALDHITGVAHNFLYVKPSLLHVDLSGRKTPPQSYVQNIQITNVDIQCDLAFDIDLTEHDHLSNFTFENLTITAQNPAFHIEKIKGVSLNNVRVSNQLIKLVALNTVD